MLREVRNVKQHPEEGFRRWFTDEYFDLIVWYHNDKLHGFQLCYDKTHYERALTWRKGEGFSHNHIDDGEIAGNNKETPILVPDGIFDNNNVALRFLHHAENMKPELRRFIYEKLLAADLG